MSVSCVNLCTSYIISMSTASNFVYYATDSSHYQLDRFVRHTMKRTLNLLKAPSCDAET